MLIFEGSVELYINMDVGTEFIIEHLTKGSIINSNSFIAMRESPLSARFTSSSTYYTLSAKKFTELASTDPVLRKMYNNVNAAAIEANEK